MEEDEPRSLVGLYVPLLSVAVLLVESQLCSGNAREAWNGLNVMMGREGRKHAALEHKGVSFANDLNQFYSRFDVSLPTNSDGIYFNFDIFNNTTAHSPITLTETEVATSLARIKLGKAPGPDGLKARVIKTCRFELTPVLTKLFQLLLNNHCVPKSWKISDIVPVPKKPQATELNDFRPVALTSILGKCMERVIVNHLSSSLNEHFDPLQFAYKRGRGTGDATLTLMNTVSKHIQQPNNYARLLFIDFSSTFNCMQKHILVKRLCDINTNSFLVQWIKEFLTDRPQRVVFSGITSETVILNTGAPQGCVLSPVLFSLYTNEMRIINSTCHLFKYADDMVCGWFNAGREHSQSIHIF